MNNLMKLFAMMGRKFGPKETAKDRREKKDRSKNSYVPPRSMTEAEQEYYSKHKHLNGFYNS